MEIRIYNPQLYRIGQIENQTSLIWTRRFFEPGEMEIHAPITEKNLKLLQPGNIISMKGKPEAAIIADIEKEESDVKNEITVKGPFLNSYMNRRIIRTVFNFRGTVEEAIRAAYNIVKPIPLVELGDLNGFEETIEFQQSFKNLLDVETKLSKAGLIGIRFRPDFDRHKIIFETYKGRDRSVSQGKIKRVTFSEKYNNLTNSVYKYNDELLKTCAIVGGEGEGLARKLVVVGGGEGLDLREIFVDARDISSDGMTAAEYEAALIQRGKDALNENIVAESLECEADPSINFTYGEDYDLGDIVSVKKKKWGLYMNQRITVAKEVYEYGGGFVVPTFGSPLPEKIDWSDK